MKKFLFVIFLFFVIFAISCGGSSSSSSSDSGGSIDSGEISILLPTDYESICGESDEDFDHLDRTYCIDPDDQIVVSIYTRESQSDEWTFAFDKMVQVSKSGQNPISFPFKLDKKHNHLRFFAKVINKNNQIKLTGGVDNATLNNPKIFLAPTGDFVRVVSDRLNPDLNSLES